MVVSICYASYREKNIRYPGKVPEEIASKDINRYICGNYIPKNKQEQAKLDKMQSANPVFMDTDGRYYYIEIYVNHYPNLVTYEGVQYTRSGSTLQRLEGPDLERWMAIGWYLMAKEKPDMMRFNATPSRRPALPLSAA